MFKILLISQNIVDCSCNSLYHTYLCLNSEIVKYVWETNKGKTGSIILLIFVLWECFNWRRVRVGGMGQKVSFGLPEMAFFSQIGSADS